MDTNLVNELEIQFENLEEIKKNLLSSNNYIIEEHVKYLINFNLFRKKINFGNLCYQIVTLLKAGLTITETIESLKDNYIQDPLYYDLINNIWESLKQGNSLSDAFEKNSCPTILLACIRSGERTSNLIETLNEYINYELSINSFKNKFISALIYPFLVLGFGIFTCLFLIFFVLPKFANLYQANSNLATSDQSLLIKLSLFLNNNYWFNFLFIILIFTLIFIISRTPNKIPKINQFLSRFKIYRDYIKNFQLYILFQTIRLMLNGGYSLIESLAIANSSINTKFINILISNCIKDISSGLPIADSFYNNNLSSKIDHKILIVSERNGSFNIAAHSVSLLHKEVFEKSIQNLSRFIEPILIIFVALIIGSLIIMMYSPIFKIMQTV